MGKNVSDYFFCLWILSVSNQRFFLYSIPLMDKMAIHCSDNRWFMCVKSIIVARKSLFTKRQRDIENSINKYLLVYYSVSLVIVTTFYIDCSAIFTRSSASSSFIELLEFGSCLPFQYKARGITEKFDRKLIFHKQLFPCELRSFDQIGG